MAGSKRIPQISSIARLPAIWSNERCGDMQKIIVIVWMWQMSRCLIGKLLWCKFDYYLVFSLRYSLFFIVSVKTKRNTDESPEFSFYSKVICVLKSCLIFWFSLCRTPTRTSSSGSRRKAALSTPVLSNIVTHSAGGETWIEFKL